MQAIGGVLQAVVRISGNDPLIMREILGQLTASSHEADGESNSDLDHLIVARLLPGP
jgi:hypothetical protein